MPIEAIQDQLVEDGRGRYQLTFERLLPLKSDDAFDLTVKAAEERKSPASRNRRGLPFSRRFSRTASSRLVRSSG
jgi:hypothetical protein